MRDTVRGIEGYGWELIDASDDDDDQWQAHLYHQCCVENDRRAALLSLRDRLVKILDEVESLL